MIMPVPVMMMPMPMIVLVIMVVMLMIMIMIVIVVMMVMPVLMVVIVIMIMVVMPVIVGLEKGILEGKGHAVRRIADGAIPERLLGTQRFPVGQLMGNDHVFERIGPVVEIGIATIRIAGLLGPENRLVHRGFPFLAAHHA